MQQMLVEGHLGNDATLTDVQGKKVLNFNLADDQSYKNAQGVKVDKAVWFDCAYWENAEKIAPFLKKGSHILVTGVLDTPRAWPNKTSGELQATNVFKVFGIRLLDKKPKEPKAEENGAAAAATA